MEENYLITIKGTMEQRGDTDTVELMTRGSLVHKDGAYYIVYKETETTGYEGCTTTVKVAEDARKVSMLRFGKQSSQLIIEKGTRHLCHYETGYGSPSIPAQRASSAGTWLTLRSISCRRRKNLLPCRGRTCPALNRVIAIENPPQEVHHGL